ncbi:uncharacterized protein OCT59_027529 [Rhizophagus irregularis]|uniref:uncharacterized protein n=1 Tax=Rhizophagus irregularis TaxID=588596 RepID=UPI0019DFCCEC|nr:hypothetical protein OCT59_027529 [Rhizophagus irregularis]GBC44886.2 hypothetical protein RIR_jg8114.t1 [Rhizophagus irregularis DAOM 181602=DAOM 197198]CAB5375007.1 unnamed protein product [Rhizophagus irregularis]
MNFENAKIIKHQNLGSGDLKTLSSEGFGIFGCGILDIDFGFRVWDTGYDQFLNASQSSIDVSIDFCVNFSIK